MGKKEVQSMFDLLKEGQQFCPCVWDCYSVKAAQAAGFRSVLLSGAAVSASTIGAPDLGIMTVDELLWVTERVAAFADVPVLVDFDEGYGDSPLQVYHNVERLVRAGAKGFTLDDGMGIRGWQRLDYAKRHGGGRAYDVFPTEHWLAKVKAALAALEGTDCLLIARTECRPNDGLEAAIERCVRAADLGAPMTLINRMYNIEECRQVAQRLPGWKMYPDVVSNNGVPEVELEDIDRLGFSLVTMHYLEKGAMWGMMDYGKRNFASRNTIYSTEHDMGGMTPEEMNRCRSMDPDSAWLEMEREFYQAVRK